MDYINAFWVGGAICALVQILIGKNKDASRKDHGDVSVSWRTAWGTWDLPAVY